MLLLKMKLTYVDTSVFLSFLKLIAPGSDD